MNVTVQEILESRKYSNEWLDINSLQIDPSYQRALSPSKVAGIVAKYSPIAAGSLIVNMRGNGDLYVMDGGHRMAAQKRLNHSQTRCDIYYGLTHKQEAEVYWFCNTLRKVPQAMEQFKARLIAEDPIALGVAGVLEKMGLSIPAYYHASNKLQWYEIQAVNGLQRIYERAGGGDAGAKQLESVLRLAMECWPHNAAAFQQHMLWGLEMFMKKYDGRYNRKELIKRMKDTDVHTLIRKAYDVAQLMHMSAHTAVCSAIQQLYDFNRKTMRLEAKE